jgi:hypothetical protein
MQRRRRSLLLLVVTAGVASLVGVGLYRRAVLTAEEQQYVGTWAAGSGERETRWEFRADRTLVCRGADPFTREPVVREYRWSVRGGRLFLAYPHDRLPMLNDPVASRWYVVTSKEAGQFSVRDESDAVSVFTRQGQS